MSADNVTPIRSDQPPPRKRQRSSATVKAIEERAHETRQLVFEAQAIVEVSRAAIGSDMPADEWSARKALAIAVRLLNTAVDRLEPGAITHTGVFRGET